MPSIEDGPRFHSATDNEAEACFELNLTTALQTRRHRTAYKKLA